MTERLDRPTTLLVLAALGVYSLVMIGATASITNVTSACSTWPLCPQPGDLTSDPILLIAIGHRIAALIVGVLVVMATALAWSTAPRRERIAFGIATLLYPVQIALGGLTAVSESTALLSGAHLLVGLSIFGTLITGLAWRLEPDEADETTPSEAKTTPDAVPERVDQSGGAATGRWATLRAYIRLTKPRLMWLLCLVAVAGMAISAGTALTWSVVIWTLIGGVLAIAASGTFNHIFERDIDRRMARTADRPLATDQVGVSRAILFGIALSVGATLSFLQINLLAAALGLAAIAYYSVVYTLLLKPHTVQNTVIGGLAGAFPAVIGAVAATGTVGLPALLLGALIFLWTPAHFYNLALAYREDYARGGFPMLPVVHGQSTTHKHILLYLMGTFVVAGILSATAQLGIVYTATAVTFGAGFLWAVVTLHRHATQSAALRTFHASNAYLGAILVAIVIDAIML